ncbi:glycine cleavage system protein GcvH [Glaciimonas sp. GG7]
MNTTKFTYEHEWLRMEGDGVVTVGITDFAQDHLGDLVFVQLPEVGQQVSKGEEVVVIESVKTASEIMMPVAGVITEINPVLVDEPGKINEDPLDEGWFFKFKASDLAELDGLMDEADYKAFLEGLS